MVPADMPWRGVEFTCVFVMWTVMMVGMMTPSAAPMRLANANRAVEPDSTAGDLSKHRPNGDVT